MKQMKGKHLAVYGLLVEVKPLKVRIEDPNPVSGEFA
jgi:hypothetical protein